MWDFLRAMLYRVRSGWFFDLWHVLPLTLLPTIVICVTVVLRDLGQKKASLLTYTEHTLKKNWTFKKGYGRRANRTMPSWKSPISGCPEKGSSLLWITCVYPLYLNICFSRSRATAAVSRQRWCLVSGQKPHASEERVWARTETVAVSFTHLQSENTLYFPTSLHHGKITLETLKGIKSNFLPLPLN